MRLSSTVGPTCWDPMHLTAPNGDSVRLDLVGYQFEEPQTNEYDANWLRIKVEAACARGHWTSVDPSLLTAEVAALADWLGRVATGDHRQSEIEFIEPNLSFRLRPARTTFRVFFELEMRPPWARSNAAPEQSRRRVPPTACRSSSTKSPRPTPSKARRRR